MHQLKAPDAAEHLAVADVLDRLILWARRAAPPRMSSTSVTTLDRLADAGPQRVTDLAAHQAVSQPSMTTLLNRLCREGYAERVPHPHDRRSMLVGVTERGRQVLRERHAERTAVLAQAVRALPVEHQGALAELVEPLRALTDQTDQTSQTSQTSNSEGSDQ